MARLTVSPELLNRRSVLSTARAQFAAGENPSLDSVVAEAVACRCIGNIVCGYHDVEIVAYETSIVREYENFGTFGGSY